MSEEDKEVEKEEEEEKEEEQENDSPFFLPEVCVTRTASDTRVHAKIVTRTSIA